ncbi:SOS response transcriptional repressor, RecA-mediated autopeptidase [Thioflavicoccus mobilis 8321]|uniref:SOS response transcriptional repressor, RecA-mediated autopeptidase n=1 Tax=Thioflavicoccus mobilis 8321 TaxID=765912 RepID=L0H1X6_9GAMM|nr:S24 family peptidase [Thioflavicoccus mobilis]AGA91655.1 SOS response transcriptional repressor, RecA-mediated autopeptidase [Thioflavicoccus mobilis 8321]
MSEPTTDFPPLEGGGCSLHESFALQVLGDEMEPELPDRCVIVVEPTDRCRDGMFVFVEVEGVRWLRQYRRDAHGERLVACNPLYPEIDLKGLEWRVLGVVIQRNIRRRVKHYTYPNEPATASAEITDLTGSG